TELLPRLRAAAPADVARRVARLLRWGVRAVRADVGGRGRPNAGAHGPRRPPVSARRYRHLQQAHRGHPWVASTPCERARLDPSRGSALLGRLFEGLEARL